MSVAKVASPTSSFLNDDFIRRTISNLLPKLSAWNLCTARASVTESTEAIERAQLRVGRGKPHLPVLLGTVVESPGYGQRRDHRSSVRLRFAMTSLSASAYASVMESFFREEREMASATPLLCAGMPPSSEAPKASIDQRCAITGRVRMSGSLRSS